MAVSRENLISPQDYITLKELVKKEVQRRSNAASVGSMSAYAGSNYDYSVTPASRTQKITDEHIQKITKPLDAVTGGSLTPAVHGMVLAEALNSAATVVANLSKKSETSSDTGCKAQCSGLCFSSCFSSCSGCTGTCTGSCTSNCKDSCTVDCTGSCTGTCTGTCTGSCSDSCSGCGGSCSNDCTGSCKGELSERMQYDV